MLNLHAIGRLRHRVRRAIAFVALLGALSACAGQPSVSSSSEARATPPPATRAPTTAPVTTPPAIAATYALEVTPQPPQESRTAAPVTSSPAADLPIDTTVTVPPGYRAEIYAQGLAQPTALAFGPDGRLYVAQLSGEIVTVDGPGAVAQVYIHGLERPLGLAWRGADLYVMGQGTLSVFPNSGAAPGKRHDLLAGIPTAGMQNNNIVLGRDDWLYIGIGSLCDHCRPDNPISGQIRRIKPDGSSWQTSATPLG